MQKNVHTCSSFVFCFRFLASVVRGVRDSLRSATSQHDRFFKKLEEEPDGFSVVADYFGRGLFEKQEAEEDGGVSGGKLMAPGASP
jgi:hypothetical protein